MIIIKWILSLETILLFLKPYNGVWIIVLKIVTWSYNCSQKIGISYWIRCTNKGLFLNRNTWYYIIISIR